MIIMSVTTQTAQIALIQFPGSNCELETLRAMQTAGLDVSVFRWNAPSADLESFDAYVIGGGFAYEDRIRAGAIAAKEPLLDTIFRRAMEGAPVLGICNGAQVLLETGLVPGLKPGDVEMALAPNRMVRDGRIVRSGHHCTWVEMRYEAQDGRTPFTTDLKTGDRVPMTLSHGEGRFVCKNEDVLQSLVENDQILFRYIDFSGEPGDDFPANPNGSWGAVAGLCNPAGNVVALMPHPERASYLYQVPTYWPGTWGERKRAAQGDWEQFAGPGPGFVIFRSLAHALGV